MCTVSYIPRNNDFILTSSRDESVNRPTSTPKKRMLNKESLIFPKDSKSGGTWIASSKSRILCLLNGKINKTVNALTKISRGQILLDNFKFLNTKDFLKQIPLKYVEPFILLQVDFEKNTHIQEFNWNGEKLTVRSLDNTIPHLWTSTSLYSNEVKQKRHDLLLDWETKNQGNNPIDFHLDLKENNSELFEIKKKKSDILTTSITSVEIKDKKVSFLYSDFISNKSTILKL
ncbi:MAG: NRDE family protein [Flavobacteriales bacterium]|nr:NRDE family protein [Flavobacteriales bacterium]MBL6872951.1 NRDE family protein [Flavobacteriales bacterium]